MLRPSLRPTLSRKIKYWGVKPQAQKKLRREARRGSHDLRKLVGHANFLDVLVSELDDSDGDEGVPSLVQKQGSAVSGEPEENTLGGVLDDDDDDEPASDDDWQDDSSDDEYHTLVRTVSGRLSTAPVDFPEEEQDDNEPMKTESEGYFNISTYGSTRLTTGGFTGLEKIVLVDEENKTNAVVSVAVVSPTMTPLASPTDDFGPSGTS
ncbi:hypothetical protein FKW77_004406 [Venturia effusa]|uniref:Uncharacterized protein n=1 Tax=Venturia effusa TaxID=50376 RepID=A0A517KZC2_9PEZI|nr:hypothetical protein FKW77_004406 [Venturia effusa]